jgi:hypothetical protein
MVKPTSLKFGFTRYIIEPDGFSDGLEVDEADVLGKVAASPHLN